MKKSIDLKSFLLGCLTVLVLVTTLAAGNDYFNGDEVAKLKKLASYVQPDGSLNLGAKRIIMQGSTIYDDGSLGGGLIIKGGANRVHMYGSAILYDNPEFRRTLELKTDLNMGPRKIVMLGSTIYDDGSQGGGLILNGGANRINVHGNAILYDNPEFRRTLDLNTNLNMGNKRITMLGSSIYDDGSEGGGLQIRGGANRIHLFGQTLNH